MCIFFLNENSISERHDRRRVIISKHSKLFLLLRILLVILCMLQHLPTCYAQEQQAMIYLSQFGYLQPKAANPTTGALLSEDTFQKAIADFQTFAGLNVTGSLDDETIKLMNMPRCGNKDKVGYGYHERSKRYALQGSKWRVKALTYKISKYPRGLKTETVDKEVAKAFAVWSKYTDLTFTQKSRGSVHIEIRFEKGEHGDGDPFDGPGGTLAHAYFPVYGGDAHFDDDEVWTIDTYRGTNLFQVAAHEFGHSLGLSHSNVRSALMAPFYRGYQPYFELDEDDVEGIQALYGKKSSGERNTKAPERRTTEPTNAIDDDPELCQDGKVDTIFTMNDSVYVFKKDHYWRLEDDGVAPGYPKSISKGWPGLPGNIDAAFTYKNGKTYFFKGDQYWRYVGKTMDGDYPKPISSGFTGIPNNIDAALVWSGNGKIYFFKGEKFWKFDPAQKPPVKNNYPKAISNWEGVPNNIDAALQYTNGYTYFFKKGAYWRFNDGRFSVDVAEPAFPRSAAYWWYGCKEATKGTLGNLKQLKDDEDKNPHRQTASSDYHDDHGLNVDDLILDAANTDLQDKTTIPEPDDPPERSDKRKNKSSSSQLISSNAVILLAILYLSLVLH